MSDIVERLRAEATDNRRYEVNGTLAVEAADLITALRAENERLRAALEPFAKLYLYPDDLGFEYAEDIRGDADWDEDANDMTQTDCFVLRRDIRCARDILKENNK